MAREKLQVLHALDVAETQRYHVRAVVIAGTGFFADAYDLFCITLVTRLLGRIYYHDVPGRGWRRRSPAPPSAAWSPGSSSSAGSATGQAASASTARPGEKKFGENSAKNPKYHCYR